jgi:triosephosphate isomerase
VRRALVAANWKMNATKAEAAELARSLVDQLAGFDAAEIVVCPPFTALDTVAPFLAGTPLILGAQDLHWEPRGAFTGAISAAMLLDAGCRHVIVGHSERRTCFGETDEMVSRKARAALGAGLRPIVCVGETLDERTRGTTEAVVQDQVRRALGPLGDDLRDVALSYEPVWAIGTGRPATAEQAQVVHAVIRATLADLAGGGVADQVRILYGGSVHPGNAPQLLAQPDIDGGLIGGASLDARAFAAIARAVPRG